MGGGSNGEREWGLEEEVAAVAAGEGGVDVASAVIEDGRIPATRRAYERCAEYFCSRRSMRSSSLPRYCASITSIVEILPGL